MKTLRYFLIAAALLLSLPLAGQKAEYLGQLCGENHRQKGSSYQGMDVCGKLLVSLQDRGVATVYRLSGKDYRMLGQFHLASYDEVNHSNVLSFGCEKYDGGDPLPLAYISQCHKKTYNGLKDILFVERIAPDFKSSSLVQIIRYDDRNGDFGYALQWVIDQKNRLLYGYGNTVNNTDPANRHRVIKFRLPAFEEGSTVVLTPEDALENYLIEDVSGFSFNPIGQGLYVWKDKLYMPTGVGKPGKPSILYVWDLVHKSMEVVDLTRCTAGELEDISRYRGHFIVQSQEGLFVLKSLKASKK
ncbi:MAG: hypothetical protein K6F58_00845 [Bacteroidales bacterium]|nr:hypothetical protein [Bacteroidales bacterium]